jgi:iron complex outermembrane receptor protein
MSKRLLLRSFLRPSCSGMLAACFAAAADPAPSQLDTVTVTATRMADAPYNVPASIDPVPGAAFHDDTLAVNLSEGLSATPGLLDRNRQDYAQDEQLSIRGFGANSTFGVLGVRLYVDDIPATQPDGQGSSTNFNLASAERVEVLRGPFSALYGNSAGGVVAIYTAPGSAPLLLSGGAAGGSYGTYRADIGASGAQGNAAYDLDFTHFHTDGYRQHSSAERESFNGKLDLQFGAHSHLSLLGNVLSAPDVHDPMGLTPALFEADPRQAVASASSFNTHKSAEQDQLGAVYEYQPSQSQSFRVLAYLGERQITQYLSIPVSSQSPPPSPGGIINLSNRYGGSDARWTWHTQLAQRPFSVVAGLSFDDLREHRRGFDNFTGSGASARTGVEGTERRNEIDTVYNLDEYLEANWEFTQRWSALAGVRRSQVDFDSADLFPVDAQHPNTSGSVSYVAATPVAGLMFRAAPWAHLYASYGSGFQTPTLDQLAYQPNNAPGLNFGLQPERSGSGEAGAKLRLGERALAEFAVFDTGTRNELVVDTNADGRSTYQNAGRTRREGLEAGLQARIARDWKLQLAYTYLDATVRDPYLTCSSPGCATPVVPVAAGNRLPGVPESDAYAALRWGGAAGWHAALKGQYLSKVPANDNNAVSAPDYALLGVDAGYVFDLPHWHIRTFARLDNLLDTRYVGAISVNDGNGRFYYPGSGRSVLAGVNVDWKE